MKNFFKKTDNKKKELPKFLKWVYFIMYIVLVLSGFSLVYVVYAHVEGSLSLPLPFVVVLYIDFFFLLLLPWGGDNICTMMVATIGAFWWFAIWELEIGAWSTYVCGGIAAIPAVVIIAYLAFRFWQVNHKNKLI